MYELHARNPYSLNGTVTLFCEESSFCGMIKLIRDEYKSNQNEWFGHIVLTKKLDYSIEQFLFFTIAASVKIINYFYNEILLNFFLIE